MAGTISPLITQAKTKDTERRFYSGDSIAARLESYIIANDIKEIGDNSNDQLRAIYEIKEGHWKGEVRPNGLSMSTDERVYRTKDVCFLDEENLLKMHSYEQRRMIRFLASTDEIRGVLKIGRDKLPSQVKMSPDEFEQWQALTQRSKPQMQKFNGFLIPPYFIYDNNFDGMNYHHAIDSNAWKIRNCP